MKLHGQKCVRVSGGEIQSVSKLLTTVGSILDTPKGWADLDVYS